MSILTGWVTNIIVLILLATVLELLLPNSSMQRYVKMVIGLMLMAVILSPVLTIFSKDFNSMLRSATTNDFNRSTELENTIESKKSEIQASNAAYIEEQMAVQLKSQVEKELRERFNLQISSIALQLTEEEGEKNIDQIAVMVEEAATDQSVSDIEAVSVSLVIEENNLEDFDSTDSASRKVAYFLADEWELYPKQVGVQVKGGE
ncbi:stage III sporulation protein AF [Pseudalkalibacillus hwajinpoensis]|uniref:Stage III sporulation protein AF n=1 Tax=Guptibacillus hwajinpoensis TaxID=208199 RepID=A0A4U1MH50_9BACL|nr:stage III sporulation protein AF [Pseudalkalibacillus hwajinpoensis]TKD70067.1 stage III sporulation protein AF [Pseudalkalibacillus hwajinpoensis]